MEQQIAPGAPVESVHHLPALIGPAFGWRFELAAQGGELRVLSAALLGAGEHLTTLGPADAAHIYPAMSSGAVCVVEVEPGAPVTVRGVDGGAGLVVDVGDRSFSVTGAVIQVRAAGTYVPVEEGAVGPSVVYADERG